MALDTTFSPALLSTGARLEAVVRDGRAASPGIAVQLVAAVGEPAAVLLPYPGAGVGGGRFILSQTETFAVLAMFSGQSEERYDLLALREGIRRVGGIDYVFGEAATYAFSPDDRLLAMAMPFSCVEWWLPLEEGEAEPLEDGSASFPFGVVRLHDLRTGKISSHELVAVVPDCWTPSGDDYDPELHPSFVAPDRISLALPWGSVELKLPLPTTLPLRVVAA